MRPCAGAAGPARWLPARGEWGRKIRAARLHVRGRAVRCGRGRGRRAARARGALRTKVTKWGGNSRTDDARSAAASAASAAARPMVCVAPTTSARAAHGPREGASGEGGRRGGEEDALFCDGRGIPVPLPPSSPTLHPRALLLPSPAAPSPLHVQSADGRAVVVSLQAVCVFAARSDQVGPGRGVEGERERTTHTHTHRRGRQGSLYMSCAGEKQGEQRGGGNHGTEGVVGLCCVLFRGHDDGCNDGTKGRATRAPSRREGGWVAPPPHANSDALAALPPIPRSHPPPYPAVYPGPERRKGRGGRRGGAKAPPVPTLPSRPPRIWTVGRPETTQTPRGAPARSPKSSPPAYLPAG